MPNPRTLTCRCGQMQWQVAPTAPGTHVVCYCADCQTAAQALGAADMLDEAGGTAIFQTLPADVTITQGAGHLALMQLGPKGLYRWHAGCCGTPIANTLSGPKFSFCGMVLPPDATGFGNPTAHVQTEAARTPVNGHGFAATGLAIARRALAARLSGRWRHTPFFDSAGQPVAPPRILSLEDRTAARPR